MKRAFFALVGCALSAGLECATFADGDGPRIVAAAATPQPTATKADPKAKVRASVVLDKDCPVVVKPFRIEDAAGEVGKVVGGGIVESVTGWVGNIVGGNKATLSAGSALAAGKLAAKRANWLPMDVEVAYGERQHAEMADDIVERSSRPGQRAYAPADAMLAEILAAVPEPHDYRFQLFVLKNATRNALALPGGFVYVDNGLVADPAYRAKAYFALAHEIAHVLQRHETRELQSNAIDSISSGSELVGMLRNVGSNPNAIVERVKLEKGAFVQHHIDEELQADSCAARLLGRAMPDVALAASLKAFVADLPKVAPPVTPATPPANDIERLAQSVDQIVDAPVKRHPTSVEREQNLRAMYTAVTGKPLPPR